MDLGCGACRPRGLWATEGPVGWRAGGEGGQAAAGPRLARVARRDAASRGLPVSGGRWTGEAALGPGPETGRVPQEVGAKSSGYARPPTTPSAAAGPAPSPAVASSEELVSPGRGLSVSPTSHAATSSPALLSQAGPRAPLPTGRAQMWVQGLGAQGPAWGRSMGGASRGRGAARGLSSNAAFTADCAVFVADCAPCSPGHFSPGDNSACKPWTK